MASKQTYECYVCKRNGFADTRVFLDGKTEDGKTIYKNPDLILQMTTSGKPKYPLYNKNQAFLNERSPILLQNSTIQHLQELSHDMPVRSKAKHITYDDLIVELIKVYRKKKKNLGEIWPDDH